LIARKRRTTRWRKNARTPGPDIDAAKKLKDYDDT